MNPIVDADADDERNRRNGHEAEWMPHEPEQAKRHNNCEDDRHQHQQSNAPVAEGEIDDRHDGHDGPQQSPPAVA